MNRLLSGGFVALACTLLAPACDDAELCGCEPVFAEITGVVFGTVFTPDSVPVTAATVAVTGGVGSCEVDGEVSVVDGHSSTEGAYEAYFEAANVDGDSICVVVQAMPPAASGFMASDALTLGYDGEDYNQQIVEEHDFYLKPGAP